MNYIDFLNISKQSEDFKCPWKSKDVSVKIFTSEIDKVKAIIGKNITSFFIMLSPLLEWETNLLVSSDGTPLSQTELSEVLDISTRTIRNSIGILIDNNLMIKINANKKSYYIVNPNYMYFGKTISIDLLGMFLSEEEIENEYFDYRNCEAYRNWKTKSLLRDNYACQCCESHNGLEVHHVNNFATNVTGRYNIDNSITLCKKCHSVTIKGSFHNIYGTRNNTKKQLQDYINNKREELGLEPKLI
jgi:biotin operon repressor